MSGTSKPDLARAGTMQITAEEAATYLDKNLTEWKKPYLMNTEGQLEDDEEEENDSVEEEDEENLDEDADGDNESIETEREEDDKAPRLAKYSTMKETAQEGREFLKDQGRPNEDAVTRGQQRKLDEIYAEDEPAAKTPRLAKTNTMTETVAAGKAFVARRQRRLTELYVVKKEAEALCGKVHMTEGIWMRKRMARAKMAKLNQEDTLNETTPADQGCLLSNKAKIIKRLQKVKQLKIMTSMKRRLASKKRSGHISRSPKRIAKVAPRHQHASCRSRSKSKRLSTPANTRCRSRSQNNTSSSSVAKNTSRTKGKRTARSMMRRRSISPEKRSPRPRRKSVSRSKSGNRKTQGARSRSARSRRVHRM